MFAKPMVVAIKPRPGLFHVALKLSVQWALALALPFSASAVVALGEDFDSLSLEHIKLRCGRCSEEILPPARRREGADEHL